LAGDQVSIGNAQNGVAFIFQLTDITELKNAENLRTTRHDPLTGFTANRLLLWIGCIALHH